jgi:hypothetical protein
LDRKSGVEKLPSFRNTPPAMNRAASNNDKLGETPIVLILPRMHGFFSLVFQAVGQAHLAEKTGVTPVVYFNRHCPYWSDEGYNGSRNVWDYFFEPLSKITVESLFPIEPNLLEGFTLDEFAERCAGTRVTVTNRYPPVIECMSPIGVSFERSFVHGLLNKHLILKPRVRQMVDDFCRAHFQTRPILGVHYRGIEKLGDPLYSRKAADPQECYLREMRLFLRKHPSARIFVATDSRQFMEAAKSAFGDTVISREVTRLEKEEESVGLHFRNPAKINGPRLGEEVLLDALILAKTDFFIHGISNVSNAVLFFNPKLKHIDVEIRYGKKSVFLYKELQRRVGQVAPPVAEQMKNLEHYVRTKRLARILSRP